MNIKAILTVTRLHLTLILQDRATYVQAFVVPAVLMVILSLALNEDNFVEALRLDVVDQDQTPLSAEWIAALQAQEGEALLICVYGAENIPDGCDLSSEAKFEDSGEDRLIDGGAQAAIIIPPGFEAQLLAGEAITLDYRSGDQLNAQSVVRTAVDEALLRFNSSLQVAGVGVRNAESFFGPFPSDETRAADFANLRAQALARLDSPAATVQASSVGQEEVIVGLGARQSVPGMGSMFVMFSLLTLAQFMVEERLQGTLARMFTLPVPKYSIVLGKILGTFAFGTGQFLVFVAIGIALGVDFGSSPLAALLLIMAFCLAGTALGFLLATLVKTVNQAGNMITMFGLLLAPLGGAWWPLSITPDFMQTIGHLSPIAWLMGGFQDLLYYQGGLVEVLPEIGALMVFAVIFTGAAILNFRYE